MRNQIECRGNIYAKVSLRLIVGMQKGIPVWVGEPCIVTCCSLDLSILIMPADSTLMLPLLCAWPHSTPGTAHFWTLTAMPDQSTGASIFFACASSSDSVDEVTTIRSSTYLGLLVVCPSCRLVLRQPYFELLSLHCSHCSKGSSKTGNKRGDRAIRLFLNFLCLSRQDKVWIWSLRLFAG